MTINNVKKTVAPRENNPKKNILFPEFPAAAVRDLFSCLCYCPTCSWVLFCQRGFPLPLVLYHISIGIWQLGAGIAMVSLCIGDAITIVCTRYNTQYLLVIRFTKLGRVDIIPRTFRHLGQMTVFSCFPPFLPVVEDINSEASCVFLLLPVTLNRRCSRCKDLSAGVADDQWLILCARSYCFDAVLHPDSCLFS